MKGFQGSERQSATDPKFMQLFKENYLDGIYALKKLDGFPENCDVIFVGSDYIQIQAGRDWQQGINFSFASLITELITSN